LIKIVVKETYPIKTTQDPVPTASYKAKRLILDKTKDRCDMARENYSSDAMNNTEWTPVN
jgi:hypothetical protein